MSVIVNGSLLSVKELEKLSTLNEPNVLLPVPVIVVWACAVYTIRAFPPNICELFMPQLGKPPEVENVTTLVLSGSLTVVLKAMPLTGE